MKKINLNGLKNVLSSKEMKNITGGSGPCRAECGATVSYCIGDCTTTTWCAKCGDFEVCCA